MKGTEALPSLLGKTIKGIIVKENLQGGSPRVSVHFVFSDDTSYEIYSGFSLGLASGLDRGGMEKARSYLVPPKGPMTNIVDICLDDE